jgi:hypothetical protein
VAAGKWKGNRKGRREEARGEFVGLGSLPRDRPPLITIITTMKAMLRGQVRARETVSISLRDKAPLDVIQGAGQSGIEAGRERETCLFHVA